MDEMAVEDFVADAAIWQCARRMEGGVWRREDVASHISRPNLGFVRSLRSSVFF